MKTVSASHAGTKPTSLGSHCMRQVLKASTYYNSCQPLPASQADWFVVQISNLVIGCTSQLVALTNGLLMCAVSSINQPVTLTNFPCNGLTRVAR